jgi:hypothetical protein
MSKCSTTWLSLYNELSHVKKNFSALKREIYILKQSHGRLLKENAAWAKSYTDLVSCHSQLLTSYNSLLARSAAKDCRGTSTED